MQQHGRGLVPAKWRPGHAATFGTNHRVEPQPHLVGAFGRDQQHAALALDGMSEERLPGSQSSRQIEHDKRLAGAPLPAQQAMAAPRDEMLHRPGLQRPRIGIAVRVKGRQFRILARRFVVEIVASSGGSSSSRSSSSSRIILRLRRRLFRFRLFRFLVRLRIAGCGVFAAQPLTQPPLPNSGNSGLAYLPALLAISLRSRSSRR